MTSFPSLISFEEIVEYLRVNDFSFFKNNFLFLHVAKSGGSYFQSVARGRFRHWIRYDGYDKISSPDVNRFLKLYKSKFFKGKMYREKKLLRAVPEMERTLISGHFNLNDPIVSGPGSKKILGTILREPVSRVVSNYRFAWIEEKAPFHNEVRHDNMDPVDFAESSLATLGSQKDCFAKPADGVNVGVDMALKNLGEAVALLGLTDHIIDMLMLFSVVYGSDQVFVPFYINETNLKKNREGESAPIPSKKQKLMIAEIYHEDIDFYDGAVELFRERIGVVESIVGKTNYKVQRQAFENILKQQSILLRSLSPHFIQQKSLV